QRIVRGKESSLCRRQSGNLGFRPGVEGLQFLDVGVRSRTIVRGIGWIAFYQASGDVPDVDDTVLRVEPSVLVDLFFPGFVPRRALLNGSQRFRASAHDDFGAAELHLLEQRLEPGL